MLAEQNVSHFGVVPNKQHVIVLTPRNSVKWIVYLPFERARCIFAKSQLNAMILLLCDSGAPVISLNCDCILE
jgi:hypothetical protein